MTRILVVSLAALLALSACGRKGPLEPPPGAAPPPVIDTDANDQQVEPVS